MCFDVKTPIALTAEERNPTICATYVIAARKYAYLQEQKYSLGRFGSRTHAHLRAVPVVLQVSQLQKRTLYKFGLSENFACGNKGQRALSFANCTSDYSPPN